MIKFLVMDVDGTLTDGKVYMGVDGEVIKAFDIKDGCGIKVLLPQHNIIPVVITARNSIMLTQRCKELGISEIHQGVRNKLDCLNDVIEKYSSKDQFFTLENVAYIGDDILDLQCLLPIKQAGGLAGCPSDAVPNVVNSCNFVAIHRGGDGAVRDFIEYIISYNSCSNHEHYIFEQRCMEAAAFLCNLQQEDLRPGQYVVDDNFFYNVLEYETSCEPEKAFESHRKNIDIQLLIDGEELMQIANTFNLQECSTYDDQKDYTLYYPNTTTANIILRPGSLLILRPQDAHRSMSYKGIPTAVKKIVGKVKI